MGTILRTHSRLELLGAFHGVFEKQVQCSFKAPSPVPVFGFRTCNQSFQRSSGVCRAKTALLDLVPETRKENLEFELPMYHPSMKHVVMDLVVVGGGPAGLAVAQQVSEAGLSVCSIDPFPRLIWPNNYGVWVDEFEAMNLLDCLDTTWAGAVVYVDERTKKHLGRPYGRVNRKLLKSKMMQKCILNGVRFHQARVSKVIHEDSTSYLICNDGVTIQTRVVLDATGFSRCLVQYNKPYNPGYQVAYGILAEVEEHPFDLNKMVFMDWRDSHLKRDPVLKEKNSRVPTFLYAMPFSSNRIFLEETSLVARPGLQMEDIQERMEARLKHLGIRIKSIEEDERCVIPMGGPLPVLPQRVVGIGGTAGMVHPSTGYMVARTLAAAPIIANSIVLYLDSFKGASGVELSAKVWKDLWPIERRRQREFFCFANKNLPVDTGTRHPALSVDQEMQHIMVEALKYILCCGSPDSLHLSSPESLCASPPEEKPESVRKKYRRVRQRPWGKWVAEILTHIALCGCGSAFLRLTRMLLRLMMQQQSASLVPVPSSISLKTSSHSFRWKLHDTVSRLLLIASGGSYTTQCRCRISVGADTSPPRGVCVT